MAVLGCRFAVAEPAGDERAGSAAAGLTLQQAAARHGAYCWVEHRLFELTGAWSAGPGLSAAFRVHLFEASLKHASHAGDWYERLPVLATVDRDELARPFGPVLGPLMAQLAEGAPAPDAGSSDPQAGPDAGLRFVAGLYRVVLPRLLGSYRIHVTRLTPVADEPGRRTLAAVVRAEDEELAAGSALLETIGADEGAAAAMGEAAAALDAVVERALAGARVRVGHGATRADEGCQQGKVPGDEAPPDDLLPWSDARCAW